MTATGSAVMNPFAGGGQNNLYRCFIDLSFRLVSSVGYVALIHQDGHLTDPKAGAFRREWYERVARHFEFINRMKTKNFAEVDHNVRFSLNIYRGVVGEISIEQITNAFVASQVEDSYRHDGSGPLPTIKNNEGNWDTRGHRDRIVHVDHTALAAIHALTEEESTPVAEARFLQPYSAKMLDVFRAMAAAPSLADAVADVRTSRPFADGGVIEDVAGWQMSTMWHETAAQKEGIIRRHTGFRDNPAEVMFSGPVVHVGNPIYKTPKAVCRTSADYEVVDHTAIQEDYLPRTNYVPAVKMEEYQEQLPRCRFDATKSHADFYRVAFRRMIALNGERSLIGAMIAPGVAHVHTVGSVCFRNRADLTVLSALSASLVFDFLTKVSRRSDLIVPDVARFRFVDPGDTAKHRALRLACLTAAYADLWNEQVRVLRPLPFHSTDPRLQLEGPIEGPAIWNLSAALRNDFARRMALVEIDVLVAQALGLTIDQLVDIYRVYFPVLQENEGGTWYDRAGCIVWSCSKGLPGTGYLEDGKKPSRGRWDEIIGARTTQLECETTIDFMPGGPKRVTRTFEGPFDTCNRIDDYKRAWVYFEKHREGKAAA
jgi:hypothetical protein